MEVIPLREEYDFSEARPNPYVGNVRRQITINLDADTIDYFKSLAKDCGIPYQRLINLYLTDCARCGRQPDLSWH